MKGNRPMYHLVKHSNKSFLSLRSQCRASQQKAAYVDTCHAIFPMPHPPVTLDDVRKACKKWQCGNSPAEEWMNIVAKSSKDEDRPFLELINLGQNLTQIFREVLWERHHGLGLPSKCRKSFPWCRIAQGVEIPFWGTNFRLECENISHATLKETAILLLRFHELMI